MAQLTNNDFYLTISDLADFLGIDVTACNRELDQILTSRKFKSLVEPQHVRQFLSRRGIQYPQQVISFQMLKGGVAKTTTCLNFGMRAAMYGARVLFIDMDQQANLSFALGVEDENLSVWVDVLEKKTKVSEARVTVSEGIDLIPSSLNNSVLDRVLLNGNRNWSAAVKAPLAEIKGEYDLILIDTAPNLSAINTAVTCASDVVVLPINPDRFSVLGLEKHLADLEEVKKDFSLSFQSKILFTKFDAREISSRDIFSQVVEGHADLLMKNYIRSSSEVKNSVHSSKSLFRAKSAAKEDYDLTTRELLGWS